MSLATRIAVLLALAGVLFAIPPAPVAAQETVSVSLTEWTVTAVPSSVVEGTASFEVRNEGIVAHNLVIIRTDLAPDALPVDEETYLVDEGQLDVVASSVQLLSDQTAEVSVNLGPGSYVLICNNIATHYQAGMYTGFQVTAAPEPTAQSPAGEPTATAPSGDGTPAATVTPAGPGVTAPPSTGHGAQAGSSGRWWTFAALAAAGVALAGLGAATYRQAQERREEFDR